MRNEESKSVIAVEMRLVKDQTCNASYKLTVSRKEREVFRLPQSTMSVETHWTMGYYLTPLSILKNKRSRFGNSLDAVWDDLVSSLLSDFHTETLNKMAIFNT